MDVSGSGDIKIDSLSVSSLAVDLSGSGNVDVTGQARDQVTNVSGSGNYQAADLDSESVDVEVNGSGEATV